MTDWYISSAAYATYTAFQTSHAYSIGNIIVPTAPTAGTKYTFRCTTAGTSGGSEPSWSTAAPSGNTISSGTATFTNVTGNATYFWTAAAGDLWSILNHNSPGGSDRFFLSSDHTETQASITIGGNFTSGYSVTQYICVNRAGSTPPVAADVTTGAQINSTAQMLFETSEESYQTGITFAVTGLNNITVGNSGVKSCYIANGQLFLNTSNTSVRISCSNSSTLILDNTTVQFGSTQQSISQANQQPYEIIWVNTPSAIQGVTIPTVLFLANSAMLVTCRGVDLSALNTTLVKNNSTGLPGGKYLFDSCKINSGVTRLSSTNEANTRDLVELINCYDGTNIINESYQPAGSVVTERTITLSSGATDTVGAFSHKMVSGTNIDKFVQPLNGFWMDMPYTNTGVARTATVEIISSGTLNNDEISLYVEYEGTSSSSVASFVTSFIATPLTTPSAVTTSTATWNSSPSTPQKQKLQVTFTPQTAGRVRGQVRLGKASTTVYVNPQMTIV